MCLELRDPLEHLEFLTHARTATVSRQKSERQSVGFFLSETTDQNKDFFFTVEGLASCDIVKVCGRC